MRQVAIRYEAIHDTADGRRLLVIHGDQFDGVIQHAKWLAYLGDTLYTTALTLNRWFNRLRVHRTAVLVAIAIRKHKVKNAVSLLAASKR